MTWLCPICGGSNENSERASIVMCHGWMPDLSEGRICHERYRVTRRTEAVAGAVPAVYERVVVLHLVTR